MKTIVRDDPLYVAIIVAVITIMLWVIAMPWVSSIALATIHRFHLRSANYGAWAAQFPIPAMYNFANRYRVRKIPSAFEAEYGDPMELGDLPSTKPDNVTPWRYLNHFPTRVFTFADGRSFWLKNGEASEFELQTRYRGLRFESIYRVTHRGGRHFEVRLQESPE